MFLYFLQSCEVTRESHFLTGVLSTEITQPWSWYERHFPNVVWRGDFKWRKMAVLARDPLTKKLAGLRLKIHFFLSAYYTLFAALKFHYHFREIKNEQNTLRARGFDISGYSSVMSEEFLFNFFFLKLNLQHAFLTELGENPKSKYRSYYSRWREF